MMEIPDPNLLPVALFSRPPIPSPFQTSPKPISPLPRWERVSMAASIPVAKAMILCDDVIPDPQTDKVHLIGVFNAIHPQRDPPFPHRHRDLSIFLQLTDAEGAGNGRVVGRKADTDRVVFASNLHRLDFLERVQVKWAHIRL